MDNGNIAIEDKLIDALNQGGGHIIQPVHLNRKVRLSDYEDYTAEVLESLRALETPDSYLIGAVLHVTAFDLQKQFIAISSLRFGVESKGFLYDEDAVKYLKKGFLKFLKEGKKPS